MNIYKSSIFIISMKKGVLLVLSLILINGVSAYGFFDSIFYSLNPSDVFLGISFIISFALMNFILNRIKIFDSNKAIPVVISLALSIGIIYGLYNYGFNFDNMYYGLGFDSDIMSMVLPIILLLAAIAIWVKYSLGTLFLIIGSFFSLLSFIAIEKDASLIIGVIFLILGLILILLKKKLSENFKSKSTILFMIISAALIIGGFLTEQTIIMWAGIILFFLVVLFNAFKKGGSNEYGKNVLGAGLGKKIINSEKDAFRKRKQRFSNWREDKRLEKDKRKEAEKTIKKFQSDYDYYRKQLQKALNKRDTISARNIDQSMKNIINQAARQGIRINHTQSDYSNQINRVERNITNEEEEIERKEVDERKMQENIGKYSPKLLVKEAINFREGVQKTENPKYEGNWAKFISYLKTRGYGNNEKDILNNFKIKRDFLEKVVRKHILKPIEELEKYRIQIKEEYNRELKQKKKIEQGIKSYEKQKEHIKKEQKKFPTAPLGKDMKDIDSTLSKYKKELKNINSKINETKRKYK